MNFVNNTFKQAQETDWNGVKRFVVILFAKVCAFYLIYTIISPHLSLTLTI